MRIVYGQRRARIASSWLGRPIVHSGLKALTSRQCFRDSTLVSSALFPGKSSINTRGTKTRYRIVYNPPQSSEGKCWMKYHLVDYLLLYALPIQRAKYRYFGLRILSICTASSVKKKALYSSDFGWCHFCRQCSNYQIVKDHQDKPPLSDTLPLLSAFEDKVSALHDIL